MTHSVLKRAFILHIPVVSYAPQTIALRRLFTVLD
ncbi:hypothetical protein OA78_0694 [Latilactobacillus curvatus]|nr:hypothetical protein OA78_0694 [Latilactobacillus curvatus]